MPVIAGPFNSCLFPYSTCPGSMGTERRCQGWGGGGENRLSQWGAQTCSPGSCHSLPGRPAWSVLTGIPFPGSIGLLPSRGGRAHGASPPCSPEQGCRMELSYMGYKSPWGLPPLIPHIPGPCRLTQLTHQQNTSGWCGSVD